MEELEQECRIRLAARSLTRWAQASELAGVRLAQAVLAVHCAWLQLWHAFLRTPTEHLVMQKCRSHVPWVKYATRPSQTPGQKLRISCYRDYSR